LVTSINAELVCATPSGTLVTDRLRVGAERDVVDEGAAVDRGEIDDAFGRSRRQRVERTEDVLAIDPQIQREVVAGAGRDTRVGQPVLGGDRGDEGLRPVAAGHRQAVGAALHGRPDQLLEILARLEDGGLEPPFARLVGEAGAGGAPVPRTRIDEDDRPGRDHGRRQAVPRLERRPRRGDPDRHRDRDQGEDPAVRSGQQDGDGDREEKDRDGEADDPRRAASNQAVPAGGPRGEDPEQDGDAAWEFVDEDIGRRRQRGERPEDRRDCRDPAAHIIAGWVERSAGPKASTPRSTGGSPRPRRRGSTARCGASPEPPTTASSGSGPRASCRSSAGRRDAKPPRRE
jgi:hypothetical protein